MNTARDNSPSDRVPSDISSSGSTPPPQLGEFVDICKRVGTGVSLVQGGGGNISFKHGDTMYIKSSGTFLRDVSQMSGYVPVRHARVAEHMRALGDDVPTWSPALEQEYIAAMKSSRVLASHANLHADAHSDKHSDKSPVAHPEISVERARVPVAHSEVQTVAATPMPSLETGFHAVLSDAVVHTHPLAVNAYTCATDGAQHLQQLFPNAILVPYSTVGVVLSKAVEAAGAKAGDPLPVFLLNHGLITHADTLGDAYEQTVDIVRAADEDLRSRGFVMPEELTWSGAVAKSPAVATLFAQGKEALLQSHAFPDSAVYCFSGYDVDGYNELANAPASAAHDARTRHDERTEHDTRIEHDARVDNEAAQAGRVMLYPDGTIDVSRFATHDPHAVAEIAHASACIALAASHLGGLTYLPDHEVRNIGAMETEKYRKRLKNTVQNKRDDLPRDSQHISTPSDSRNEGG